MSKPVDTSDAELPPFTGAFFLTELARQMIAESLASSVNVVAPKPPARTRKEPARQVIRIDKDGRRSVAGPVAPPAAPKSDEGFSMPQMPPTDLVAMPHLRKPRAATALVSAKPAAPHDRRPVVRVLKSVGLVARAAVSGVIDR